MKTIIKAYDNFSDAMLFTLFVMGPGRISLDYMFRSLRKK